MVEVKSATRVKEHHLQDIAIQAWVAESEGLPLDRLSVAVVDTGFVYPGGGDYRGLLQEIPVADQARPLMARTPGWVRSLGLLLAGPLPAIARGVQCRRPFDCPFDAFCREQDGAAPRPAGESGSVAAESPVRHSDPALGIVGSDATAFLAALPYPRAYLDFETCSSLCRPGLGRVRTSSSSFNGPATSRSVPARCAADSSTSAAPPRSCRRGGDYCAATARGSRLVYSDFEKSQLWRWRGIYPDWRPPGG